MIKPQAIKIAAVGSSSKQKKEKQLSILPKSLQPNSLFL